MHKASVSPIPRVIVTLILLLFLNGCGKSISVTSSIGILSAAVPDGTKPAGIAFEQKTGYNAGLPGAEVFIFEPLDETAPQSDLQRAFRDRVQDPQTPMVALLGGTSNSGTSRAAALANFFNVPMIVPTAGGDDLFPSNNLWAFRLSAPGKAYANYLFGKVITRQDVDAILAPSDTEFTRELRVAILYEANTFGESAAVATAEAVMAQSIRIGLYAKFAPENTDPAELRALAEKAQEAGVQLVYLISSDPAVGINLVQTFRTVFDQYSLPVLVGQAGGFIARDFLDSKEAEGVYILRQQIDRTNCPAEIQSSYEAQTYAAVDLLRQAIQEASDTSAKTPKQFSLRLQPDSAIGRQREAIRDALKRSEPYEVACLGQVAFDNTGQKKFREQEFELVRVVQGMTAAVSPADFLEALKERLANLVIEP